MKRPTWLVWHQLAAFGNSDSSAAAPASGLTLTDEVPLDGSATAELFYL